MNKTQKIELMIERTAALAANASSLRGQGPSGTILCARRFLRNLQLRKYKARNEKSFRRRLNSDTNKFAKRFSKRNWGAARKILNIFLRDVLYNRYLCEHFEFDKLEHWLEVPLDGLVAERLFKETEKKELPRWPRIKRLTAGLSRKYQLAATRIAAREGIAPVHLDLIFWRRFE